jgi:hypothetical protein
MHGFCFPFLLLSSPKLCCQFAVDTVYTFSSRLSCVHYSLFSAPPPSGCSPRPTVPSLRINGHPFLLALLTHSVYSCDIVQSIFRHILLPATSLQNSLSGWISQTTIFLTPMLQTLRKFDLWSFIPDFKGDISVCCTNWAVEMVRIPRERGLKHAPCSYSCLLKGSSSACILWAVGFNEMSDELGRLWP